MPGIFGIISIDNPSRCREQLKAMHQTMLHESSYTSGLYINEDAGLYSGWTSHKDSFADCMPVFNEKQNNVLLFSGENFPDLHLFDYLKTNNHKFNSSKADYLIHLYEEEGEDFVDNLNGWHHGLIHNLDTDTVLIFNDRFGMHRMYYYRNDSAFFFASEAKAILRIVPESRTLDPESLAEYLCCNCVLDWKTLFKDIRIMPGASIWRFKNKTLDRKRQYFSPETWERQSWLEKEFFYQKFRKTLREILPRYFRASQDIGISLTGGLDTRIIMANLDTQPGKYPCYTFNSVYRDCNDVKVARKVSEQCGLEHHTIQLGKEFLSDFNRFAEETVYITDGNLDISGAPEIYVNRLAREIAPIRITGNHGSELLRSIRWMKATMPDNSLFDQAFSSLFPVAMEHYDALKSVHPLTFTFFLESPWHECNRYLSESSQMVVRTPYQDKDLVALMYRAPLGIRDDKEVSKRLILDGNPGLAKILTDRGVGAKYPYPLSLVPRLYNEVFFKCEYYCNYGMPQWLSKIDYLLKPLKPERLFLGRHKFYHFRVWYRDELADYVRAVLLDRKSLERPYLDAAVVKSMVSGHLRGTSNHTTEITKLMTLELVNRLLIES